MKIPIFLPSFSMCFYLLNALGTGEASDPWMFKEIKLHRLDPGKVGDVEEIYMGKGKKSLMMKTLSLKPPIWEIPNFLNKKECKHFIKLAIDKGVTDEEQFLKRDKRDTRGLALMDSDNDKKLSPEELRLTIEASMGINLDDKDIDQLIEKFDKNQDGSLDDEDLQRFTPDEIKEYVEKLIENTPEKHGRYSQTVMVTPKEGEDPIYEAMQKRIATVTEMHLALIKKSDLQVVKYGVKGHLNAHYDSGKQYSHQPCCIDADSKNCQICRFMSIMVYLNDVEEGGQSAFLAADNATMSFTTIRNKQMTNLHKYCDESMLHIKPELGKMVMWYNHEIDSDTEWMGKMDKYAFHGECDVTKGEKWVANFWLRITFGKAVDVNRLVKVRDVIRYPKKNTKEEL